MPESVTKSAPIGDGAWTGVKGTKMSVSKNVEIVARPSAASFAAYLATKYADLASFSPAQMVEVYFLHHSEWQGSDERKAERAQAREAKLAEAEAKKAEREARRAAKDEADREKILAAAKRLGIVPSDVVKEAPKK